eukprot:gene17862-biopygen4290
MGLLGVTRCVGAQPLKRPGPRIAARWRPAGWGDAEERAAGREAGDGSAVVSATPGVHAYPCRGIPDRRKFSQIQCPMADSQCRNEFISRKKIFSKFPNTTLQRGGDAAPQLRGQLRQQGLRGQPRRRLAELRGRRVAGGGRRRRGQPVCLLRGGGVGPPPLGGGLLRAHTAAHCKSSEPESPGNPGCRNQCLQMSARAFLRVFSARAWAMAPAAAPWWSQRVENPTRFQRVENPTRHKRVTNASPTRHQRVTNASPTRHQRVRSQRVENPTRFQRVENPTRHQRVTNASQTRHKRVTNASQTRHKRVRSQRVENPTRFQRVEKPTRHKRVTNASPTRFQRVENPTRWERVGNATRWESNALASRPVGRLVPRGSRGSAPGCMIVRVPWQRGCRCGPEVPVLTAALASAINSP